MYKLLLFIYCCGIVSSCLAEPLLEGCVEPPLECPNENVTFWLYTRANKDNPHELRVNDPDSIQNAPWVPDAPIKVIIHGYECSKDLSPNTEIRPAYLKCCDYNIISVDYNPLVRSPCYVSGSNNTELAGKCIAQMIDELVINYGFKLEKFHPIGFSLGGEVDGFLANYLKSGKLHRLTALEPSLPFFTTSDKTRKIDKGDALFVDVLHTNALLFGKLEPCGHVDFYANGGSLQPGCEKNLTPGICSHYRASYLFAESITTDVGFYGTECSSWFSHIAGSCKPSDTDDRLLFGEYVPYNSSGLYFFDTNSKSPFSRGKNPEPSQENDLSTPDWYKALEILKHFY